MEKIKKMIFLKSKRSKDIIFFELKKISKNNIEDVFFLKDKKGDIKLKNKKGGSFRLVKNYSKI